MLIFSKQPKNDKGDTLIEVLFAVTVFSLVVVTAMSLMHQGTSAAQRSLEITLVRQQVDGQAEALRFLHSSYVEAYQTGVQSGTIFNTADAISSPGEEYYKIIQFAQNAGLTSASQYGGTAPCTTPANSGKKFVINPVTATLETTATNPNLFENAKIFSQLTYSSGNILDRSQGMWIEAVRANPVNAAGYIDFHIRACWDTVDSNTPMNIGTIVRLYEPRG